MRTIVRAAALLLLLVAIQARGQWTALGEMPQPTRQGNALRFENAQAVAVITALSPEVIRVRITPGPLATAKAFSYVVEPPDPGSWSLDAGADTITLRTPHLVVEASLGPQPERGRLGLAATGLGLSTVEIDCTVDVRTVLEVKRRAMSAHASQIPETSSALRLPESAFAAVYGYEWYGRRGPPGPIDDLRP